MEDTALFQMRQRIADLLSGLDDTDAKLLTMRFGLEGRKELTQKEVAQKMGISQSYISRLEKRIMLRLRKEMLREALRLPRVHLIYRGG